MDRQIAIGRWGRLVEEIDNHVAIAVRSNHDRGSIAESIHDCQTLSVWELRARSTHDRGPIDARLWPDRGANRGSLKAKLWLLQCQSGSHDAAKGNHSHDPFKSPPRPHQKALIFGRNLSLKRQCILFLLLTFDRFMK